MIKKISISTRARTELVDITARIQSIVKEAKVSSGTCQVYIPHTTAAVTINENADPSVRRDIACALEKIVPFNADYEHMEGNAAAHIKSTMVGTSATVFIEDGQLRLGTWQGVFFCEFDGPRQRNVIINIIKE